MATTTGPTRSVARRLSEILNAKWRCSRCQPEQRRTRWRLRTLWQSEFVFVLKEENNGRLLASSHADPDALGYIANADRIFVLSALAGSRREILCLIRHPFPLFGIGWGGLLEGDIRPQPRVFSVDAQTSRPLARYPALSRGRTFRLANPAVDTFVRMNDQHILALIETIDGADFHTVHQFAFDATLIDYIGHRTAFCQFRYRQGLARSGMPD